MPRATRLERVKGSHDVLPPRAAQQQAIAQRLLGLCALYGYRQIDVPILEHVDLYLRKSGEDTLARLYSFSYQNRKLSLRPELTASVVRAYVEQLETAPQPQRLCYAGPAFRYEAPQRSRHRQFTQVGVELIGAAGPSADAEVMALALHGLDSVGLQGYRVVIGHLGVLLALLQTLHLDERLLLALVGGMETLVGQGPGPLLSRLNELTSEALQAETLPTLAGDGGDDSQSTEALLALVQALGEARARTAILELLAAMNVGLEGSRDREEIVDRLLTKFSRAHRRPQISQALALMAELGHIRGEPSVALAQAEALLLREGAPTISLEQIRAVLQSLSAYDAPLERFSLDFGLSRGLQYYTGLIFEVYHEGGDAERQLLGGGRYDDLVMTLGGSRDTPACGFSYGLERLLLALEAEQRLPGAPGQAAVLVAPVEESDQAFAVHLARTLRRAGISTELDVKARRLRGNLQYAGHTGIPIVIIAGGRERETGRVTVRDMRTRREERVALEGLADYVRTQYRG